jgi:hypothetical protein
MRYEYRTDPSRWRTIFECDTLFVKQQTTVIKLTIYAQFNHNGQYTPTDKFTVNAPDTPLNELIQHYQLLPKKQLLG